MTSQPLHQPRFSLTIRVEISSVVNLCSGIAPLILLESHSPLGNYSGRCSRARPALNYFELNCTNERTVAGAFFPLRSDSPTFWDICRRPNLGRKTTD